MRDRVRTALSRIPGAVALVRLVLETVRVCLRYRVTGLASEGAFFMLLSLPPLVLGLFAGVGYVGEWVGADNTARLVDSIRQYASRFLTEDTINQLLVPTIDDVLSGGRADLISFGFLLALWSGSRALNVLVDTVSIMYGQGSERGIVRTRVLSLSVYTLGVLLAVVLLPLVLLGPGQLSAWLPERVQFLSGLYWPVVLALSMLGLSSIYAIATPRRAVWWRNLPGAVLAFVIWALASLVVREVLAASMGGTSIYGPLSTPIILLVWLYALAIAILIGAGLNAATLTLWPARLRRSAASRALDRAVRVARRRGEAGGEVVAMEPDAAGLGPADAVPSASGPAGEVRSQERRDRDQQYERRERSALAEAIDRELSQEMAAGAANRRPRRE